MNPLDFVDVATQHVESQKESERRTSIGRSYYGLFNHVKEKVAAHRFVPADAEAHEAIVLYLSNANNTDLKSIGQSLKDLRVSRNDADYDMSIDIGVATSKLALVKARTAIQRLAQVSEPQFNACMKAQPNYKKKDRSRP